MLFLEIQSQDGVAQIKYFQFRKMNCLEMPIYNRKIQATNMKNLKNCFFQSIGAIMVLMLFFNSFHSGWCQVQEKKDLTPEDYHLWHKLQEPQISDDGVWISYLLSYESGMDTLMLQQRTGKERFFFSGGSAYNFAGNKWFIYKIDNKLKIFDLKDYTMREYPDALEYKIVHNNKTIVFLSGKNHEKNKEL